MNTESEIRIQVEVILPDGRRGAFVQCRAVEPDAELPELADLVSIAMDHLTMQVTDRIKQGKLAQ